MQFGMPALFDAPEDNAALCHRLGLHYITDSENADALCLYPTDTDERREALLAMAVREKKSVVLCANTAEALAALADWANHWLNRSASPDELWDVYDEQGRRTGKTHRRGDPLGEGERHLCVHIWVRTGDGRYLITRRSPNKSMAGRWECTGGSVIAGEDSLAGALREVREETGLRLDPACGQMLLTYGGEHFICDVWLFRQAVSLDEVTLQEGETCEAALADADTIRAMAAREEFVALEYLEQVLRFDG
ncbi:MAG: NUDIX domain-containing protein [Oscillospiraceae bacterium]|nr:NUDIX domain-containing protein [Oscillospiraceae bacterium]